MLAQYRPLRHQRCQTRFEGAEPSLLARHRLDRKHVPLRFVHRPEKAAPFRQRGIGLLSKELQDECDQVWPHRRVEQQFVQVAPISDWYALK